jgi:hypothetical protein
MGWVCLGEGGRFARWRGRANLQCFSTLNSNLAYCYNDKDDQPGEAIKNKFAGGVRSFADRASNVSPDTWASLRERKGGRPLTILFKHSTLFFG